MQDSFGVYGALGCSDGTHSASAKGHRVGGAVGAAGAGKHHRVAGAVVVGAICHHMAKKHDVKKAGQGQ